MAGANSRARSWCFTLNNPPGAEPFAYDAAVMKYLIYQLEVAPTTATPHFQGYVVFQNPKSLVGVRALAPTAHWAIANGSADSNIVYCSKEPRAAPTVEHGQRPAQGTLARPLFFVRTIFVRGTSRPVACVFCFYLLRVRVC